MHKLLVTGGAGFIGANFVHFWRQRHADDLVVVLDALTYAGNSESLADLWNTDGFEFVLGNIGDYDLVASLLKNHDIDTIVHFAAESHVDRSIHGPDAFIETNINGTYTLLKAAKAVWVDAGDGKEHRFHHVSTDEVYGSLEKDDPAFTETTPYSPNSPYSASKASSDHLVRAYAETYGLQTTITNCSNNYGPYQFPEKLIPLFLINALKGEPLPIYGDGQNIRDWLHVSDHCLAIELVLARGVVGQTYNVGGNCEMTNLEVIDRLCAGVDRAFAEDDSLNARFPDAPAGRGSPTTMLETYVKDRPGHDRRYAIDTTKISRELGYVPKNDFDRGFDQTLRWYLENEAWWNAVLDGSYREWIKKNYSRERVAG